MRRGEIFGFLGPNGAGKTTAIKLLLGLAHPTSGSASLLGAPLGDRAARRKIGYLPELFRYQGWMEAAEVLDLHARLAGIAPRSRPPGVSSALETVGLAGRGRERVAALSKGMQQRLGLAVALVGEPDLVFLDEPTSALDPVGRHEVRTIVERLAARGATIFLNSHLLTEVERICGRVAIVDAGTVVAQGSMNEILGGRSTVRVRLDAPSDEARAVLTRLGTTTRDGDWYVVADASEADVPQLIADLVREGARILAVESTRATLEQRFLEILRPGESDAAAHDRPA